MNPYIFEFNGYGLRWYSALILIGTIFGILLAINEGKRFNYSKDDLFNMAFYAIIFGIIGARFYYVIFNLNIYKNDLISVFKVWEGGLAIHGGLIAGILTIYIYTRIKEWSLVRTLDICVPSIILAQSIGRWGNFFNSEAHGAATTLAHLQSMHIPSFIIKGMHISGIYYEPTFFYESLLCFIGFLAFIFIRRFKYIKVGMLSCLYLLYYGFIRFFIESMRTDSLMLGGFKAAQIVSIIMMIVGIVGLMMIFRKDKYEDLYNAQ